MADRCNRTGSLAPLAHKTQADRPASVTAPGFDARCCRPVHRIGGPLGTMPREVFQPALARSTRGAGRLGFGNALIGMEIFALPFNVC